MQRNRLVPPFSDNVVIFDKYSTYRDFVLNVCLFGKIQGMSYPVVIVRLFLVIGGLHDGGGCLGFCDFSMNGLITDIYII